MTLSYPPPWQDVSTLCAHLCISPNTVDAWVKQGWLPAPRNVGGKRLWRWADVDKRLAGGDEQGNTDPATLAGRIRDATKAASQAR